MQFNNKRKSLNQAQVVKLNSVIRLSVKSDCNQIAFSGIVSAHYMCDLAMFYRLLQSKTKTIVVSEIVGRNIVHSWQLPIADTHFLLDYSGTIHH